MGSTRWGAGAGGAVRYCLSLDPMNELLLLLLFFASSELLSKSLLGLLLLLPLPLPLVLIESFENGLSFRCAM